MITNNQILNIIIKKEIRNIDNDVNSNKMKRGEKLLKKYLSNYDNTILFLNNSNKEADRIIESVNTNIRSSIIYKKIIEKTGSNVLIESIEFYPKEVAKIKSEFKLLESMISDLVHKNKIYTLQYEVDPEEETIDLFELVVSQFNYVLYNDFSEYMICNMPIKFDDYLIIKLCSRDNIHGRFYSSHGFPKVNLENPVIVQNIRTNSQLKKMIFGILNQMIYDLSDIIVDNDKIVCSINRCNFNTIYDNCESIYIHKILGNSYEFIINRYIDILINYYNLDQFIINSFNKKNIINKFAKVEQDENNINIIFDISKIINLKMIIEGNGEENNG